MAETEVERLEREIREVDVQIEKSRSYEEKHRLSRKEMRLKRDLFFAQHATKQGK